jgi:hypothetical protein
MTDILIRPDVQDPVLETDDPIHAHIVGPLYGDNGEKIPGRARMLEAMVSGTPVEALCGYLWVPSHNPDNYPLCSRCEALVGERVGKL